MTIYPTGTCFEDVTQMFIKMLGEDMDRVDDPEFCMVHGICLMEDGSQYAHAWIEEGEFAWFSGILNGDEVFCQTLKSEFHSETRVVEFTRYTYWDCARVARQNYDMPPPWEHRYRRLCKDFKKGDEHGSNGTEQGPLAPTRSIEGEGRTDQG